jgi:DnaK suppressor protein
MTDTQKSAVRQKISSELERIARDIIRLEEITRPFSAEDMDDITRMDSIVNKSVNDAALSAARSRLAGLEYALKRFDDPEFGYCIECGEEISFARILSMPETVHCIDCAS